ncbi:MAG: hypothetical protein QNK33_00475 [Bacteroidales bacterium]|nr:hypothetical protein [Bacteroidales bacterium]
MKPARIKLVVTISVLSFLLTSFNKYDILNRGIVNYQQDNTISFKRVPEPNEKAFSLLLPDKWIIEGGIYRINPLSKGGAAQSIAAKCDLTVKSDKEGSALIRWLPDMLYFDMRNSPAQAMFPEGSNYNGMTVLNKMYPRDFILNVVIPYAHPQASNIAVQDVKELPELAKVYSDYARSLSAMLTMTYYASIVSIEYSENGRNYCEKIVSVVEDYGQLGVGLWGNKQTFLIRTQGGRYETLAPVFSIIQRSVEFNSTWLLGEIKGQMTRSEIMQNTLTRIQDIDNMIIKHQELTNTEINNDMFLTLMDQEEYVNPFTNKVETGSNQWQHRWVNELGGIIYTNNESFNPNHDPDLNNFKYQKSPVRKR